MQQFELTSKGRSGKITVQDYYKQHYNLDLQCVIYIQMNNQFILFV